MNLQKKIFIRTDGNSEIATGHLMRCLTIARALRDKGAFVTFLLSDDESFSLLFSMLTPEEKNLRLFGLLHMQSRYDNLEEELTVLTQVLKQGQADCLLIDSYYVTGEYLKELRKTVKVAYIDDIQAFDYDVDLIFNYDITVDTSVYQSAGKLCTGGAYTPLRSQFSCNCYHVWETVEHVLLSTGGTDPYNIAGHLLYELLFRDKAKDICFHVILGSLNPHREKLAALAAQAGENRLKLHQNVADMAGLMKQCDLAVSAAGTTLYELCAIGVPSISFTMADNQIPGAKAFADAGLIAYGGDIRDNPDFFKNIADLLLELMSDFQLRSTTSERMQLAIDGAGALRIADELLHL